MVLILLVLLLICSYKSFSIPNYINYFKIHFVILRNNKTFCDSRTEWMKNPTIKFLHSPFLLIYLLNLYLTLFCLEMNLCICLRNNKSSKLWIINNATKIVWLLNFSRRWSHFSFLERDCSATLLTLKKVNSNYAQINFSYFRLSFA